MEDREPARTQQKELAPLGLLGGQFLSTPEGKWETLGAVL